MLLNIPRDKRQFNKTGFALLFSVTQESRDDFSILAEENRGRRGKRDRRIWRRRWRSFRGLFHGLLRKVIGLGLSGKGLCIYYYCAGKRGAEGESCSFSAHEEKREREGERRGETVSQEGEKKAKKEARRWQAFLEVYNEALFCERL